MYILTISERALQSKSNRFCSHKARSRVDNDRFKDLVSAADLASMGSFEVIMDRREVLEERDVKVVLIDVRLCRQRSVVNGLQVERVTRRRVVGLDLLPFISIDIPSELDRSTPTSSTFVSGFERGHEVFRGTHASNQIGGVHERKEVDILLTRRVKASNSSDCLIEVAVSESSRSSLINRRQLDKVDGGTWCDSFCTHRVRSVVQVESTPGAGLQCPVFDVEHTHIVCNQVERCLVDLAIGVGEEAN